MKSSNPQVLPSNEENNCYGIKLRDYFANSAMQSLANIWYEDAKKKPESIAKISYDLADAMLKQREL